MSCDILNYEDDVADDCQSNDDIYRLRLRPAPPHARRKAPGQRRGRQGLASVRVAALPAGLHQRFPHELQRAGRRVLHVVRARKQRVLERGMLLLLALAPGE